MITIKRIGDKPARALTDEERDGLYAECSDDQNYYYFYSESEMQEQFKVPAVTRPDWHNLEQTLRYAHDAALFTKAFTTASDKGLNLFMTTLVNGKLGHSSENALAFAFSMLGVTWTDTEKGQINAILKANKFSIQI